MAGVLLYGVGVNGCLDLAHSGLEFDKFSVGVMVSLNLGLQPPVSIFVDLVHDEREWGSVGCNALEEPGGDDVGGCVAGNGGKSLELMGVDSVVGTSQSALDTASARDTLDIVCQEFDAVRVDPEVGDTASIFFEAVRTLLSVVSIGGGGACLLVHEVLALIFQFVDPLLHGLNGLVSGGEGDLLCPKAFIVGSEEELDALGRSVGFVHGRLGNLLCKKECHFG